MALPRKIDSLNLKRLKQVLSYDPETGHFSWRIRTSPMCKVGGRAGKRTTAGYRRIAIDRVSYTESQLAWLYHYGSPPPGLLDHKNGDRSDNRISNLRLATHSENSRNIGPRRTGSTGLKGASRFNNPTNKAKFRSSITVNGKRIFLGLFMTAEEAHEAYCRKAAELHGEFAKTTDLKTLAQLIAEHRARNGIKRPSDRRGVPPANRRVQSLIARRTKP